MRILVRSLLVCVAAIVLSSATARAEEPKWKYVEAGYLSVDVDSLSDSGDNWFVGGAWGFGHFHVIGQYSNGELGPNTDQDQWRLGFGWHGGLGDKADIVGEAYWVDQSVDSPGSNTSDSGYRLTGGVRWLPIKMFELDGFVNYNDVTDSDTSWEARAIVNVWKLGFGAAYEKFDDADQWNAFVRFNFGR